jgi:hypothetical protein
VTPLAIRTFCGVNPKALYFSRSPPARRFDPLSNLTK